MARRAVLFGAAGRYREVTVGGTGAGAVPAVPGGAINVKNSPYNATGNGTTDDGAAIRSAITAAGTGGTVYFPTGTYKYVPNGTFLDLLDGVTLLGAGPTNSIILHSPTSSYVSFAINGGDNVTFHSLQIKRNTNQPVVMFPLRPHAGVTFDNCILDGNYALGAQTDIHCFQLGRTGTLSNVRLLNTTIRNWVFGLFQDSADTGTTNGFTVRNCLFSGNHRTDLEFNCPTNTTGNEIQNVLVEQTTFTDNSGDPGDGFGVGLANCRHATIQRNLFQNFLQESVHIEDRTDDVEVAYNRFINVAQEQFSAIQVITASNDVRIRHNVIDGTGTKGVSYIAAIATLAGGGAGGPPLNILIDDNTIDRGSNLGIYHQCIGVTVTNNRFNPSVSVTNGGSTGTVTVSGSTVSTAYPADY